MESLASTLLTGNVDWMDLAGKMLGSLKEPNKRKKAINMKTPPVPKPRPPKKQTAQIGVQLAGTKPSSFAATVQHIEALRMQLLRQLVIYQKQLMALKIPHLPVQFKTQKYVSNKYDNPTGQLSTQYDNNSTFKGGRWLVDSENSLRTVKNTKPKKTSKRKSKSKKALEDLGKPSTISSPTGISRTNQNLTRIFPNNNIEFPFGRSGLDDIYVPSQCNDDNYLCQKCLSSKNKICKKKKVATKGTTKHTRSYMKKVNQDVVEHTCPSKRPSGCK